MNLMLYAKEGWGSSYLPTPEQRAHLRARRIRPYETLWLTDGLGKKQLASWEHEHCFMLEEAVILDPPLPLHLALAWSKPQAMDWAIEKATELGVTKIMLLISERCGTAPSPSHIKQRMLRFHNMMIAAMCQSMGCFLPEIQAPMALKDFLKGPQDGWVLLDPVPRLSMLKTPATGVIVGPEGGWSDAEKALMQDWPAWQLGTRILRVETAVVSGLTLLRHQQGWR